MVSGSTPGAEAAAEMSQSGHLGRMMILARQLVEPELAQHGADTRDAIVVFLCPHGLAVGLRIFAHAAELEYPEHFATKTDALLAVEHGRGQAVLEFDARGDHQHDCPGD